MKMRRTIRCLNAGLTEMINPTNVLIAMAAGLVTIDITKSMKKSMATYVISMVSVGVFGAINELNGIRLRD